MAKLQKDKMDQKGPAKCAYERCSREPLKTSKEGLCMFHAKAEDKSEEEIKGSLRDYISEIKKKDSDYNFSGFVFVGDIDFKKDFGVTVFKKASFIGAAFEGGARFGGAVFKGSARFIGTEFKGDMTVFAGATFEGKADFFSTSFYNDSATFFKAVFKGSAMFQSAFFEGGSFFDETIFEGYANFVWVRFKNDVSFEGAIFRERTSFDHSEFHKRAIMSPGYTGEVIEFNNVILENSSLGPFNFTEKALIDFRHTRIRNTDLRREYLEGHILQEEEREFSEAKEIYLALKNSFHTIARYDDESWASIKEKDMERKSFWCTLKEKELGENWKDRGLKDCSHPVILYSERIAKYLWNYWLPTSWKRIKRPLSYKAKNLLHPVRCVRGEVKNLISSVTMDRKKKLREKVELSWKEIFKALVFYLKSPRYRSSWKYFKSTFLKYLYGWGERPWRIFGWCGGVIVLFSFLYCCIGEIATKGNDQIVSYWNKLYFSGVTFTALGYGDYYPVGVAKITALTESFLGVVLIALFIFSFARRTAGR